MNLIASSYTWSFSKGTTPHSIFKLILIFLRKLQDFPGISIAIFKFNFSKQTFAQILRSSGMLVRCCCQYVFCNTKLKKASFGLVSKNQQTSQQRHLWRKRWKATWVCRYVILALWCALKKYNLRRFSNSSATWRIFWAFYLYAQHFLSRLKKLKSCENWREVIRVDFSRESVDNRQNTANSHIL